MQRAVTFLAHRDRTSAQVEQFLESKGASSRQITQTIRRLCERHYLDDHAYAERWVERRLVSRPMGPERLTVELLGKGISDTLAAQVVAKTFRTVDEDVLAHRLLVEKFGESRRGTIPQVVRCLRQRGFTEDTIDRMVRVSHVKEEQAHDE